MKEILKKIASALLFAGAAAVTVILTVICIAWFDDGFIYDYGPLIASVLVTVEVIYVLIALVFLLNGSQTVYKFMLTGLLLAALILIVCFVLQVTGFLDKIDSVEALQEFIDSRGSFWAPLIFIALQMLQVFLLPLPGVVTVGAGVLLFGVWETCLYSYIGIVLGSLIGFAIGRVIGYRAAAWLVGRESLDSWLEKVKGKDRRLLTVMFLLPIFPDDILCFVAGLSTMSWKSFIIVQLFARAFSVVLTSLSVGGMVIPYDTWWGILCWLVVGAAIIALFILLYKKGDAIERWFFGLFRPKKKGGTDQNEAGGSADAGGTAEAKEKAKKKGSAARARNIPPPRGARPASEK